MKRLYFFVLCLLCVTVFLSACSTGLHTTVQLTEEQQDRINVIVENREKWEETMEELTVCPVNRIHISEINSGYTILTVAHMVKEETGSRTYIGVRGYAVDDGELVSIGRKHHEDWVFDSLTVDMEAMSDQELRDVLEQSYLKFINDK